MRLDKYLKVSRLIKRRTVANDACDNERVMVNGRVQRASYDVKPGDRIAIRFGQRTLEVEVLTVADNVGKAEATLPLGSWAKMLLPSALISLARTEWGISVPNTLILLP